MPANTWNSACTPSSSKLHFEPSGVREKQGHVACCRSPKRVLAKLSKCPVLIFLPHKKREERRNVVIRCPRDFIKAFPALHIPLPLLLEHESFD